MTTNTMMLRGDSLLEYVNSNSERLERGELTRTDLIKDAGYVYDNGMAMYTDFYTELLRAKGVTPVTDTDTTNASYEELSTTEQELYDHLLGLDFTDKWDYEEFMEFMGKLDDIGITTADKFSESFVTCGYTEKEFAEYWYTDVCCVDIPESLGYYINWQDVWDCELRYDFSTIDFDFDTFFFRNQ